MARKKLAQLPLLPDAPNVGQGKRQDWTLGHWAVSLYRRYMKLTPDADARLALIKRIDEFGVTAMAWEATLVTWNLNGYSPKNIAGMLEYVNAHPGGEAGPKRKTEVQPAPEPVVAYVVPDTLMPTVPWAWDGET